MTFDGFKINLNSRSEAEVCLTNDAARAGEHLTAEERITGLFETLRDSLFHYVTAVFGRSYTNEAEDITQEAFLQLYKTFQNGQQVENPRAWLFKVGHNLAINRLRSQQFVAPLDGADWDEVVRTVPDPGLSPEQRAERFEDFATIHEAMKRLSQQERQCLNLRAEGLRYREIAEILGIAVPTVSEFLRRAIKKMMVADRV